MQANLEQSGQPLHLEMTSGPLSPLPVLAGPASPRLRLRSLGRSCGLGPHGSPAKEADISNPAMSTAIL